MKKLQLPILNNKSKKIALNMVLEKGLDPISFSNILKYINDKVHIVKFTSGIALVDNGIQEKIALCKQYNIDTYFGGTLFEKYYSQGLVDDYLELLREYHITSIEISNGTIDINLKDRVQLIKELKNKGFKVYVEIGSKDAEFIMTPSTWIKEMQECLDAGADYLITESRESGSAGVFRASGEIRGGLVQEIVDNIDLEKVIFEAPNKNAQCYFINNVSPQINLGNIALQDINILQVQRLGLRYDTFFVK